MAAPRSYLNMVSQQWQRGFSSRDLVILILVSLLAIHLREIFALSWLAVGGSIGVALNLAASLIGRAAMPDLAAVCLATVAITVLAGARRNLGRDIELAAATVVPIVFSRLLGVLGAKLAIANLAIAMMVCGYAWSLGLIAVAIVEVRRDG